MSTNVGLQYGSATTIACTLASLANNSARQSNSVTNTNGPATGIGWQDDAFQLEVKTGASGTSSSSLVQVYISWSPDGGTTWIGGATGSDGSYTINGDEIPFFAFLTNGNATKFTSGASVRQALGFMPQMWAFIVLNSTGAAFDSTEGNHLKQYQGIGTISS